MLSHATIASYITELPLKMACWGPEQLVCRNLASSEAYTSHQQVTIQTFGFLTLTIACLLFNMSNSSKLSVCPDMSRPSFLALQVLTHFLVVSAFCDAKATRTQTRMLIVSKRSFCKTMIRQICRPALACTSSLGQLQLVPVSLRQTLSPSRRHPDHSGLL